MRLLSFILLSLFAISASASHMLGGGITWQKTANGDFVFELVLYRECGGSTANMANTQNISGPAGSITLTKVSNLVIAPVCTGGGQIQCGVSMAGVGAVEKYVYKSSAITLAGTPPAIGWNFVYSSCCMPTNIVNLTNAGSQGYYFQSTMYPGNTDGSPYFVEDVNHILTPYNSNFSVKAISPSKDDSLYYSFVAPKTTASSSVSFASGYSAASPFPSSQTNAANGAISLDSKAGIVSYDAQVGVAGSYAYTIAVEQWRNGVLISRITRGFAVAYSTAASSNSAPSVSIDTSTYTDIVKTGPHTYKTYKYVGDSLNFNISSADYDINQSTFALQNILFYANGAALAQPWNSGSGIYNNTAVINPVAPQSGYTSALNNDINFQWGIKNEHFNPHNNSHFFTFTFKDDQCPVPGETSVILQVVVKPNLAIINDTVYACVGDSVQLSGTSRSGNYSWTPAADFSDPTVANPKVLATTSGYYYLTDPVTNAKDSVYVSLTQAGAFTLGTANGKLKLTDANGTTNRIWYYCGVPFYYPLDTLTPFGYGDYWVKSAVGPCVLISDTVTISYGQTYSVFDPNNGGYNGANMSLPGSIGATFQINQSAGLNSVTLLGVEDLYKSGTGYDLNLKIYDANQTEVFSTDVTLTPPFFGPLNIPVSYNLQANTKYTVAVSGDSALTFKLYENVSYPATPHHNGITVSGSYEGAAKQFPSQPSNYLLPITLNTDAQVVGLKEQAHRAIGTYPNPANDKVTVSGLNDGETVDLFDLQGRLIKSYTSKGNELTIERGNLSSGVYLIKMSNSSGQSISKVFFE